MKSLKQYFVAAGITLLPLIAASLLARWGVAYQFSGYRDNELDVITVRSTADMERAFEQMGYLWPLPAGSPIPRVTIKSFPRDLDEITDVERRKSLFFRALLPSILAENRHLRDLRSRVQTILKNGPAVTGLSERRWLYNMMAVYRVQGDIWQSSIQKRLLRRLDEIPPSLVLAQAANESGWGTSRFALEGNNLFGIWTFQRAKGIIPAARAEDMQHAVRVYPNIRASIKAYLYTLNIGDAYQDLRILRETMRQANQTLDALVLADGLVNYSQRGSEYVDEVRSIIEGNQLNPLDTAELKPIVVQTVLNSFQPDESTGG